MVIEAQRHRGNRGAERRREISVFSVVFPCLLWFLLSIGENLCQSVDFFLRNLRFLSEVGESAKGDKDTERAEAQRSARE